MKTFSIIALFAITATAQELRVIDGKIYNPAKAATWRTVNAQIDFQWTTNLTVARRFEVKTNYVLVPPTDPLARIGGHDFSRGPLYDVIESKEYGEAILIHHQDPAGFKKGADLSLRLFPRGKTNFHGRMVELYDCGRAPTDAEIAHLRQSRGQAR